MDLNLDSAIRSREFPIFLALFNPSSPNLWDINNPKRTLRISLIPKKRKAQVERYLNGVDPQGFVSSMELNVYYVNGVNINGEQIFGFEAIAHMLSRHLEMYTGDVEELIEKKFKQGFARITFVQYAHTRGVKNARLRNKWTVKKAVPKLEDRLHRMNLELKNAKSRFRATTSKTYTTRIVGA